MDEEQQIIQEPVQEPAPEKQSDKTQAILTAVSPLVAVFFGGSAGVNIIPPPDLLAGLEGCQPSGGQSRKEYSECPDFLGDLYGCGLSFMFDPDRVRARPRRWLSPGSFSSIIAAVKAANGNYDYVAPFTIKFLK